MSVIMDEKLRAFRSLDHRHELKPYAALPIRPHADPVDGGSCQAGKVRYWTIGAQRPAIARCGECIASPDDRRRKHQAAVCNGTFKPLPSCRHFRPQDEYGAQSRISFISRFK